MTVPSSRAANVLTGIRRNPASRPRFRFEALANEAGDVGRDEK